jgi:hypothetical protein
VLAANTANVVNPTATIITKPPAAITLDFDVLSATHPSGSPNINDTMPLAASTYPTTAFDPLDNL